MDNELIWPLLPLHYLYKMIQLPLALIKRGLYAVLIISSFTGELWAQNEELNFLRRQAVINPKNIVATCELCHAFAEYGMIDSAEVCLKGLAYKKTPSPEVRILKWMTRGLISSVTGEFDNTILAYDSAIAIVKDAMPSFRIQQRTYLEAINNASAYGACEQGLLYAENLLQESIKAQNDSLLMLAYIDRAKFTKCLNGTEVMVQADIDAAKAIGEAHKRWKGDLLLMAGRLHLYFNDIPQAIAHFLESEQCYTSNAQYEKLYQLYYDFSEAYEYINDFKKGKYYMLKAMEVPGAPSEKNRANHYNGVAWNYYRLGELDSAMFYLLKSIDAFQTLVPGNPELAYPFGNLGLVYRQSGELDEAEKYSNLAIDLFEVLNHEPGIGEALNNLGFIDLERANIKNAEQKFKTAKEISSNYGDSFEEMNSLEGLIQIYTKTNPKEALKLYEQYLTLKLQMQGKEDALKALQVEVDFYEDQNKNRIAQLQFESKMKSLEIERKNLRILGVSIGLFLALLLAGIFYFYWYQHLKFTRSLESSNEINQRIISMISHDFRGPLNNVKLTLELLQAGEMEKAEFNALVKDLYRQSSDVSLMFDSFVGWAISQKDGYEPSEISFQWAEVIEEVVNISKPLAELKNIKIYVRSHSNIPAETDRMAVSLIFRNLISNAIKYSHHESPIEISYELDKEKVVTKIKDNGIGMDMSLLQAILKSNHQGSTLGTNNEYGAGLGLRMVIKYVHSLKGIINAYSKEGEGTTFIISIPKSLGN